MSFVQVKMAGGLGNRMFQYAFARGYAERHKLELRCDPSVLNKIFELPDYAAADQTMIELPNVSVDEWDGASRLTITGMGQHQKCLNFYTRTQVRSWFKLRPKYAELVKDVPVMELVANLRRGDYCFACNPFVVVSEQSYLNCCDKYGLPKEKIFWLDGEQHYRIPQIPVEKPWIELSDEEQGKTRGTNSRMDFLPDLALMMRAKILLRSNSTFAWWAATLGDNDRVFSPDTSSVDTAKANFNKWRLPQIVPFVEGNHLPVATGYWFMSELRLAP